MSSIFQPLEPEAKMNSTGRNKSWFGISALIAMAALSFFTPWTEIGSFAKLTAFPLIMGAIGFALLSWGLFARGFLTVSIVLGTAWLSALHSNGFDWRMDNEWNLVVAGLVLHGFFALVGFAVSGFSLRVQGDGPEPI